MIYPIAGQSPALLYASVVPPWARLFFSGSIEGVIIFTYLLRRDVLKAVWPIWLGYLPLGFACGVLAQKVGVSAWESGFLTHKLHIVAATVISATLACLYEGGGKNEQ